LRLYKINLSKRASEKI